nr:MAG TPA: hypothetical protein [Caudoviricetes sp.]
MEEIGRTLVYNLRGIGQPLVKNNHYNIISILQINLHSRGSAICSTALPFISSSSIFLVWKPYISKGIITLQNYGRG